MIIGVPRETKNNEYRVAATPACVAAYVGDGHSVLLEVGAGLGAGYVDDEYRAVGAVLITEHHEVFARAHMLLKVKEPLPAEYDLLRPGQLLFTFLHLAAAPALAASLTKNQVQAIAYETIQLADGSLPCLKPMSAIAGRLAVQQGAKYLERPFGGRGVLLGGVPGVQAGRVAIVGGGIAGTEAAKMAVGLGAHVTVLDISQQRLYELDALFGSRVQTLHSTDDNLARVLTSADLVIGAVLIPGATAPKLIRRAHLQSMLSGSVIVDVAVDQGGCTEFCRPTTHDDPVFTVDGVQHYCVANMPAAVSRTATSALVGSTLAYGRLLAANGLDGAVSRRPELDAGINTRDGHLVNRAVRAALSG